MRMLIFTRYYYYLLFTLIALMGWGSFAEGQVVSAGKSSPNPKVLELANPGSSDKSDRLRVDPITKKIEIPKAQVNSKAFQEFAKANKGKKLDPHAWIPNSGIVFKPNVGQIVSEDGKPQPQIKYEVASNGMQLYFTDKKVHYVFGKPRFNLKVDRSKLQFKVDEPASNEPIDCIIKDDLIDVYRVDLNFIGANPSATVLGEKESEMYFNFFLGSRVRAEQVKGYQMLVYRNLYNNIDLVFYGKGTSLKYDFVVHPGGRVSDIKLQYDGAQNVSLTPEGGLRVVTPLGEILEDKPFSFQNITATTPQEMAKQAGSSDLASKVIINGNIVTFNVDNHDPSRLLIIDPTVVWSQFYGGATLDIAMGIDVDKQGNVFVCGMTSSTAFPTFSGTQVALRGQFDGFVIKTAADGLVNPNGWATYYGSNTPNSGQDAIAAIAVDNAGNAYVAGITNGNDLVTESPVQAANAGGLDLFSVGFGSIGNIRYATYYGGTGAEGIGDLYTLGNVGIWGFATAGISVDVNGEPVIVSATNSNALPQTNKGFQRALGGRTDVILLKLTTLGQYRWATYFGGSERDAAYAVAHDGNGNIYFTGATGSTNLPVANAFKPSRDANSFDAMVAKFDATGKRLWASYYGGNANDNIDWMLSGGVIVDSRGDVVITGHTQSPDNIATTGAFITTRPGGFDCFVAKISGDGGPGALKWGTYLGGGGDDLGYDVAVLADDKIAITGETSTNNLTTTGSTVYQATYGGDDTDGFITILEPSGAGPLFYQTYVGGNGFDNLLGIAVASNNDIHVAGQAGSTNAFLTSTIAVPARQATAGSNDAIILKFSQSNITPTVCGGMNTQPVRLGVLKYKMDFAHEYPYTLAALSSQYTNYTLTEFTNPTDITAAALAGIDVLLIPEIEDPTADFALFTALNATLNTWVTAGGTVIFLGSNDQSGGGFETAIFNTGLLAGTALATNNSPLYLSPTNFTTCLTNNVGAGFISGGTQTPYDITSSGYTNVIDISPQSFAGVRTLGAGKVILLGFDFESYERNQAQMLANAVTCYPTSGKPRMAISYTTTSATCKNKNDGEINLEVKNAPLPIFYSWSGNAGSSVLQDVKGLIAGTYTVTVSAGPNAACRDVVSIIVRGCDSTVVDPNCISMTPKLRAINTVNVSVDTTFCVSKQPPSLILSTADSAYAGGCGNYDISPLSTFEPIDLTALPEAINITDDFISDDRNSGPYGLGFDFNFYCNRYNNVYVSDNGYVTFNTDEDLQTFRPQKLPSDTIPNNLVALNWAMTSLIDGNGNTYGNNIRIARTGTKPNRKFIVDFEDMRYVDIPNLIDPNTPMATGTWSGQIIFYEGDSIDLLLRRSDAQPDVTVPLYGTFPYPKTMGIENATGTTAHFITGRNQNKTWKVDGTTPVNQKAYRFRATTPKSQLTYKWFRAPISGPFTQVAGATSRNLTILPGINPPLTDTTRFMVQIQHGRNCFTKDTIQLNVTPLSVGGTIDPATETVCPFVNNTLLTLSGHKGSILRWESSKDNFATKTIISATTTTIRSIDITTTTSYRAVVKNGLCDSALSAVATITTSVPVIDPNPIITAVKCNGGNNGKITLNVSQGVAPYTFLWSRNGVNYPVDTNKISISNILAGTFSVTVTDDNGCKDTLTNIVVTEPALLQLELLRKDDIICRGQSDGRITVVANGGVRPYTYRFAPSLAPQADSTRNDLAVGCYTITVTDANSCEATLANICLTQPTAISFRVVDIENVKCKGGNDGAIQLDVTGGVPNYVFSWDKVGDPDEDIENLSAGDYKLTVRDRNGQGCAVDTTITITEPEKLTISDGVITNVSCKGGNDGKVNVDISGGVQNYTYKWSSGETIEDPVNKKAGVYCLTITDANNCSTNKCFTITEPQALTIAFTDVQSPKCSGGKDGCVRAVVTGGNGGYRYSWSNGVTSSLNCSIFAGKYTITVTDSKNCAKVDSITITEPKPLNIAVSRQKNVSCKGAKDGEIQLDITGGTIPYSYSWGDLVGAPDPEDRTNLAPGTYSLTLTDANNCTLPRTFVITEPDSLKISVSKAVNPSCNNDANGLIDVEVTGGTRNYKYLWTLGSKTIGKTEDLTKLVAGDYKLVVTDTNGCTATASVSLKNPEKLTAVVTKFDNKCFGECKGRILLDITGGTGSKNYFWSNGATIEDIENLCNGVYSVTVTDSLGCTLTESYTITSPTKLVIKRKKITPPTCYGVLNGVIDIEVTGGVQPYQYLWSNSTMTEDLANGSGDSTRYIVKVQGFNGCIAYDTIPFSGPDSISVTIDDTVSVGCFNGNNGYIKISASGGTPFPAPNMYRYSWTKNGSPYSSTKNIQNLTVGNYCVTVTDSKGCTKSICVEIKQPTKLTATIKINKTVSCFSGKDAEIEAVGSGGTEPYGYKWAPIFNDKIYAQRGAGSYVVTITDANSCTASATITLTEPPKLNAKVAAVLNVKCSGDANGVILLSVTGGTKPYVYNWNPGPTGETQPRLENLAPGSYTVTVVDANNCEAVINDIKISQPAQSLSIATNSYSDVTCNGAKNGQVSAKVSGGSPPYSIIWSNGFSGMQIKNLPGGDYCATVTDANGCTANYCQKVSEPDTFKISVSSIENILCFGSKTGSISVLTSGGNGSPIFSWQGPVGFVPPVNPMANSVTGLAAGNYIIRARDTKNCQAIITVTVTQATPMVIGIVSQTNPTCNGTLDGTLEVSVTGGINPVITVTGPDAFTSNSPANAGLKAGTYLVTAEDTGGCVVTKEITMNQPDSLRLRLKLKKDVSCPDKCDGELSYDIEGGTPPYTYVWDHTTIALEDLTGLCSGDYRLTVTDKNGCSVTSDQTITEPDPITITLSAPPVPASCSTSSDGQISIEVEGGTPYTDPNRPKYNYRWSYNNVTDEDLIDAPSGSYSVEVTDSLGCSVISDQIVIEKPDELSVEVTTKIDPTCNGKNDGQIAVNVKGGTEPYNYEWYYSDTLIKKTDGGSMTDDIKDRPSGPHRLVVISTGGCLVDTTIILDQPDSINIVVDELVNPICSDGNTGSISLTITGGTGILTFAWTDDPTTVEDRTDLGAGDYTIAVIDENGCRKDTTFTIVAGTATATINGLKEVYCRSEAPDTLTAEPAGGIFSGTGVSAEGVFDPSLVTDDTTEITYEVDVDGCTYKDKRTVRVKGDPTAATITFTGFPSGPPFCSNNGNFYVISYTPLMEGVSARFSGPGVTFNGVSYLFVPSAAGSGSHKIIGTFIDNITQCISIREEEVLVSDPSDVTVSLDKDIICKGEEAILTVNGATSYSVSPTNGLSCAPNCNDLTGPITAIPNNTSTYFVTAKTGGCSITKVVKLMVKQPQPISIKASATQVCANNPVTLTASSKNNYKYTWEPAVIFDDNTLATAVATPSITTTVTVTGTIDGGCSTTQTILLTVKPSLASVTADKTSICPGGSATLTASTPDPGTFTYSWNPTTGLSSPTGSEVTASPSITTTYTVTRSGSGSCRTATVRIEVVDTIATIEGIGAEVCEASEPIELTGSPEGGKFNGPGMSGSTFDPKGLSGAVTIVYSGNGPDCPFGRVLVVNVKAAKNATITNIDTAYCSLASPKILTPGIQGSKIEIDGTETNILDPKALGVGEYEVKVTPPSTACAKDSIYVIKVREPEVSLTVDSVYCLNSEKVKLEFTPSGARITGRGITKEGDNYFFNPSLANVGTHTITVTGTKWGCTFSLTRTVKVQGSISASPVVSNASGANNPDGTVKINVTGASGNITYKICDESESQSTNEFTGLLPGTYCFEITSGGGCKVTIFATVGVTNAECTPPNSSSVSISNIGKTSATVSWGAVNNSVIYFVDFKPTNGPTITMPSSGTTLTVNNLVCATDYEVVVRVLCNNGSNSPNTQPKTFRTSDCTPTCTPPTITTVNATETSAVISWNAVPGAVSYQFTYKKVGSSSINVNSNTTSVTLNNLEKNATYEVCVKTVCAGNVVSDCSPVRTFTTGSGEFCGKPTITSLTPALNTVKVEWNSVNGATGYQVSWRKDVNQNPWTTVILNNPNTKLFNVTNLMKNTRYCFRVRARCGNVFSPFSDTVCISTLARSESNLENKANISVYPNPNKGDFSIIFDSEVDASALLQIFDATGRMIVDKTVDAVNGNNTIDIDLSDHSSGIYMLRFTAGIETRMIKIIRE